LHDFVTGLFVATLIFYVT